MKSTETCQETGPSGFGNFCRRRRHSAIASTVGNHERRCVDYRQWHQCRAGYDDRCEESEGR